MSVVARRFVVASGLAMVGLGIAVGGGFVATREALVAFVLVVCGVASLALVRAVAATTPGARDSLFDRALDVAEESAPRPPGLTRIEIDLALGQTRVAPMLRAIAAARLASEHGVELERRPDAARALLGPDAWELVRADSEPRHDLLERGLPLERIAAAVDALERL